jgi:hypothetical protein
MSYIDNSGLFNGLPERHYFSKGAKILIGILLGITAASASWGAVNHNKIQKLIISKEPEEKEAKNG